LTGRKPKATVSFVKAAFRFRRFPVCARIVDSRRKTSCALEVALASFPSGPAGAAISRTGVDAGHEAAQADALEAITPPATSHCPSLAAFLKQIRPCGRYLAKWNFSLAKINRSLMKFDQLAGALLAAVRLPVSRFYWPRISWLNQAFYEVREAESQAFFGLHRAETEARDLNDLVARFARVLVKALGADAAHLVLKEHRLPVEIGRPLYIERGSPYQRWIFDAPLAWAARTLLVVSVWALGRFAARLQLGESLVGPQGNSAVGGLRRAAGRPSSALVWRSKSGACKPNRCTRRRKSGGASAETCTTKRARLWLFCVYSSN
jgi:hypothetical protein